MGLSKRSIKLSKGFTLIELVMVIVILGILAAMALPKFVDLSTKASDASVAGVAGAISAGSAANFAAKKAGGTSFDVDSATVACSTQAAAVLQGGALPSDMTITDAGGSCAVAGNVISCTVTQTGKSALTAVMLYCTS